ncbi:SH3 domain-containing protein [Terrisporobacter glycolicus]|uniref:SH3b domain-containing protein n=1 Tax=Terrisporobacter glycolicus ATCC 14880 = DSM 1288 TaxID=1121315 RepID=A0ABZ2EV29_9FIRM|nr:SH3 domain-containing protein [Terrisporobacter glycolicus]
MLKNTLKATAFASMAMALGACASVESQAATVKEDLNLREGASTEHNVKEVLDQGQNIKILSESNGWYKVKTSDDKTGWSYGKYVDASKKEKEEASAVTGTVTEYLNFRKGPSIEDEIINVHEKGESVKVLSKKGDWYKVKASNGEVGWSYRKYIKVSDAEFAWSDSDANGTLKDNANMRKGASTNYDVIKVLDEGEKVKVISSLDGWYKLQTSDGKTGWVHSSHLDTDVALMTVNKTSKSSDSKESSSVKESSNKKESSKESSKDKLLDSEVSSSSKKSIVVSATAYSGDGVTATGTKPRWGTIAVDPSVIPYGTKVYIPRFGKTFIAEDCGGGIKGNKIDIFMNSESQCNSWGVRNISIQILD